MIVLNLIWTSVGTEQDVRTHLPKTKQHQGIQTTTNIIFILGLDKNDILQGKAVIMFDCSKVV